MVKRTEKVETGDETSPVTSLKFAKYLLRAYSPAHACPADRGLAYSRAHARPQPARPGLQAGLRPYLARSRRAPPPRGLPYKPSACLPRRPAACLASLSHARPQPNGCSSNSQLAVVYTAEPGLNVADDRFHTAGLKRGDEVCRLHQLEE
jgi:hypothetical protein